MDFSIPFYYMRKDGEKSRDEEVPFGSKEAEESFSSGKVSWFHRISIKESEFPSDKKMNGAVRHTE